MALLGSLLLVSALPGAAAGHVLSKSTAKAAARGAATRLARRRPGDAGRARFTGPTCRRRSAHRFVCRTTLTGSTACDPAEATCDGPAPWQLTYEITVRFRSGHSGRLRVTAVEV